ncbi:MAG: glycosyltransferase family 2 protein [Rhodothermaceae bacterium]
MDINLSTIIVNYNTHQLLDACLSSLFEYNTSLSIEVIVIDNNSQESGFDEIVSKFKDLVIIKNKSNLGFGKANNQGIEIAKGKYILLLNSDTYFTEDTLSKVHKYLETKNEKIILGCRLLNADSTLQHSVSDFPGFRESFMSNFFLYKVFPKKKFFNKYHLMNKELNSVSEVDIVTGAFMIGKTEFFKELKGFDERFFFYFEEIDLCYRVKQNGGKIVYFPETEIYHVGGGSANSYSFFKYSNQSISTIKFYQKHFKGLKFTGCLINHYTGILIRIPLFFFGGLIKKSLFERAKIYCKLLTIYPKNDFK